MKLNAEIARATTIVRFAPGSYFSEHEHGGGEQFIIVAKYALAGGPDRHD